MLIFLGGGSAFSFRVPGLIDIIKNIASLPEDIKSKKLDNESKELDVQLKRIELKEKLKASGIDPKGLVAPLEAIANSTNALQTEPIILDESAAMSVITDGESEESNDIDEE